MGISTTRRRLLLCTQSVCLLALSGVSACSSPRLPEDPSLHAAPFPSVPQTAAAAPQSPHLQGLTIVAHERPATSLPTLRIPETTVGPDPPIPPEIITRIFRRDSRAPLRACYVKVLLTFPALTGDILTQFVVGPDGAVHSAEVTQGLAPELDACVLAQINQTTFPRPRGGQVIVRYPFHFLID